MALVYFSLTYKIKVYFLPQVFSTRQNHEQMKGCIFGFFPSDLPIQLFPFFFFPLVLRAWFGLSCYGTIVVGAKKYMQETIYSRDKKVEDIKLYILMNN
jgi:hypothetical protein